MMKDKTKSQQQYERWKPVTVKADTKQKLEAICAALSTDYATVKQVSMLDILITEKYNSLLLTGDIKK